MTHLIHQATARFMLAVAACMLLLGFASSASAQQTIYETISVAQTEQLLKKEGYSISKKEDNSLFFKIEGNTVLMIVAKDQKSLQFYAYESDTNTKLETINRWNRDKRYSRSYIDKDGDPVLELDLDLEGGVTDKRIVDFILTSRVSYLAWRKEVL